MTTDLDVRPPATGRAPEPSAAPRRYHGPMPADLVLAVLGGAAVALVLADVAGPWRIGVGAVAWLIVPGWALVRLAPLPDVLSRSALTVVASAALSGLVALPMLWLRQWYPDTAAAALLGVAAVSLLIPRPAAGRLPPPPHRRSTGPLGFAMAAALVGAVALWAIALTRTSAADLGEWGLLDRFPPYWYLALLAALALTLGGAMTGRNRIAASALSSLVLMLFLSAPLIEAEPRLPWLYKHIAVVRYIDANGALNPLVDIYNRWPGFFAADALFGHAIGVLDPTSYAAYAEAFFGLLDVLLVVGIARVLFHNVQRAWIVGAVFATVNWVGQNYFAPQAYSYSLFLAMALILMRYLRAEPGRVLTRIEGGIRRVLSARDRRDLQPMHERVSGRPPAAAVVSVLVLQALITVTHQLTPFIAAAVVLPLALLGYFRPRWLGLPIAAMPLLFLIPNAGFVESSFGLFSSLNPVANAFSEGAYPVPDTLGTIVQERLVDVLNLTVLVLAIAGLIHRLRRGDVRDVLVVVWFAFAPAVILAVQSYGGEARLRVLLFGFPWAAIAVTWLFVPVERARSGITALLALTTSVLLGLFTVAFFQPEQTVAVTRPQVAAMRYLDHAVRYRDLVVGLSNSLPALIGPRYPVLGQKADVNADLYYQQEQKNFYTTAPLLAEFGQSLHVHGDLYVVFSPSQRQQVAEADPAAGTALGRLQRSVAASPTWTRVFDDDGVQIYRTAIGA